MALSCAFSSSPVKASFPSRNSAFHKSLFPTARVRQGGAGASRSSTSPGAASRKSLRGRLSRPAHRARQRVTVEQSARRRGKRLARAASMLMEAEPAGISASPLPAAAPVASVMLKGRESRAPSGGAARPALRPRLCPRAAEARASKGSRARDRKAGFSSGGTSSGLRPEGRASRAWAAVPCASTSQGSPPASRVKRSSPGPGSCRSAAASM